jgi:hypothetical protein
MPAFGNKHCDDAGGNTLRIYRRPEFVPLRGKIQIMASAFVSEKGQALLNNKYAARLVMEKLSEDPKELSSPSGLEVQIGQKTITLQPAGTASADNAEDAAYPGSAALSGDSKAAAAEG